VTVILPPPQKEKKKVSALSFFFPTSGDNIVLGPIFRRALNPKVRSTPVLLRFDDFFYLA